MAAKTRTFDRLMRLECYAYGRWLRQYHPFWHDLAAACCRAVRGHADYRGAE